MTRDERRGIHDDKTYFRDALSFTESETGFAGRLIEKDYYGSLILADLFSGSPDNLVFKGGTSLSKVHGRFFRLSEDLDFALSAASDVSRTERREKMEPIKTHLAKLRDRTSCLRLKEPLHGHNNSTQYVGEVSYHSVVSGEDESIKVEVSVREPILEGPEMGVARTLLMDPFRRASALEPISVRVLSTRETYAEKIRAALTRRDPAIRDFFDVGQAIDNQVIRLEDQRLLDLTRRKLAIPGNDPVSLSSQRRGDLERQLESQLRPVLRDADFEAFHLEPIFEALRRFATRLVS